jgi:hypothetical protein
MAWSCWEVWLAFARLMVSLSNCRASFSEMDCDGYNSAGLRGVAFFRVTVFAPGREELIKDTEG